MSLLSYFSKICRRVWFVTHRRSLGYAGIAAVALTAWMLSLAYQEVRTQRVLPNNAEFSQSSLLPQRQTVQFARQRPTTEFDLSASIVPKNELHSGGPPKDGIPALTNPKFITSRAATYLQPADRVIGVVVANQAKAYPLKILNYHEIVNDRFGDTPVAVIYCPLCDSCTAFNRRTEQGELEFGVSGLLYNSNVLMFDRGGQPEGLWSQIMARGITGPSARVGLLPLPLELTTWKEWLSQHPNSLVLSSQTGHQRNYNRSPYGDYFSTPRLMFPVKQTDNRLPAKARVLGVWTDTTAKAYPESYFAPGRQRVEDIVDGKKIVIQYNNAAKSMRVVEADQGVQWMYSLWFAWYAFHPETEIVGR
ncbi:DUF3179 domain-containing protein [Adhaeretor mobilis]|uniref:DUF3179 domain-containing protein n=1 Tax=Adhaeretor mobilis TaxID=1930276 RepID=A0A517N0T8_9BACT|nr:DUF3179 domain-containing protein [Adhaeretor mobilis]QDT00747.1 hypothetical protein HG15A2_40870 [Adhaeretor mobilis]